jgi:hypothetical protein
LPQLPTELPARPRYRVELRGDSLALEIVRERLQSPELLISKDGDTFYLTSTTFETVASPAEVRRQAVQLIPAILAAARIAGIAPQDPVLAHRVEEQTPDGPKNHVFVEPATAQGLHLGSPPPTISINGEPPQRPKAIPAELAQRDPAVRLAVECFAPGRWMDLYKVLDVIVSDGADPNSWATKDELRLFKWTANNVYALGADARHGLTKLDPPPTPMTHSEALELVGRVLEGWLNSKVN